MPGLPKKVREAGEQAEAELQKLKEGAPAEETGSTDQGTPAAQSETPKPEETAPKKDEGTPAPEKEQIDWKAEAEKAIHKFNVLNGKYQSEVPQLHDEIRQLKERLKSLESGEPAAASPGPSGETFTVDVPDEIKEMYGDEMPQWVIDVAKKAAEQAVKPFEQQVQSFTTGQVEDKTQVFFDALSKAHPDWETINGLEAFQSFLAETVEELGVERQAIIDDAQKRMDPKPVILQIDAFKKRYSGSGEQQRLASQEAPSDSGGTPPPAEPTAEKIKESDIAAFYKAASLGKYKRNPEEYARLEGLIRKAQESGNIIMDMSGGRA